MDTEETEESRSIRCAFTRADTSDVNPRGLTSFNYPLSSNLIPEKNMMERIDDDLREIFASHQPDPISDSIREKLHAILGKYETT